MGSLSNVQNTQSRRVIVSVGDFGVTKGQGILSTYALGTCLGVLIYDPKRNASSLLHLMLPDSTLSPEKAAAKPAMFADTGIPAILESFDEVGGNIEEATILLAGGASPISNADPFKIAEKNINATKAALEQANLKPTLEELGGVNNRTLLFDVNSGEVTIKTASGTKTLSMK